MPFMRDTGPAAIFRTACLADKWNVSKRTTGSSHPKSLPQPSLEALPTFVRCNCPGLQLPANGPRAFRGKGKRSPGATPCLKSLQGTHENAGFAKSSLKKPPCCSSLITPLMI